MPHVHDVQVRWSDEDRLGHINNTRYLTFVEDARLGWLHESPAGNGGVILTRVEIDFRVPVHFATDGRLVVHTSVTDIGRSSVQLRQDILAADRPGGPEPERRVVAAVRCVLVCFDYDRQSTRPWRDEERGWLQGWQDGPAERAEP